VGWDEAAAGDPDLVPQREGDLRAVGRPHRVARIRAADEELLAACLARVHRVDPTVAPECELEAVW
jgi:hypothetical protein